MHDPNDVKARLNELLRRVRELDPKEVVPKEVEEEMDKLILLSKIQEGEITSKLAEASRMEAKLKRFFQWLNFVEQRPIIASFLAGIMGALIIFASDRFSSLFVPNVRLDYFKIAIAAACTFYSGVACGRAIVLHRRLEELKSQLPPEIEKWVKP